MRKDSCRCSDKALSPASMALLISYPQVRGKLLSVQISPVIWAGFQSPAQQIDLLSSLKSSTMLSRSKVLFTLPSQFPAMERSGLYLSLHLNKPVAFTLESSQGEHHKPCRDEEGGTAQARYLAHPWTTSLGEVGPQNTHHWLSSLKQPLKQVEKLTPESLVICCPGSSPKGQFEDKWMV